ncbi:MAG: DUF4270 domain-containing protein [Carboxylicivirga sp.]|jgi:hypothetical protein|nr:DUF4270 domain-containing protein [Carboxylicivirga sp.]
MHRYIFNYRFIPFLLLLLIGSPSCQEGELDLGDDFISFPTYTALIDTVTMQLSTFKADSIVTSSTSNALIGYYRHPVLGGQEAKSYFSLNYPSSFSWDEEKQIFDSLVVVLKPNAYSIGDTIVDAHFQIHRLSEEIETHDDGKLYNTSSFSYDEVPIAKESFRPYPKEQEKVKIRINDGFAMEIIDFLNTYKNHVDKNTLFAEQFKGLVFLSDTSLTKAAMGFSVSDTTCYLRLYSHKVGLEQEDITNDFTLSNSTNQFNQLSSNDETVIYNQISNAKSTLKSAQTNRTVMLQSGSGLKFRVDFPSMNSLLELKTKGYIVKAILLLRPDMTVMKTSDLPAQVYIGDIYRSNDIWGYLTDGNNNPIASQLTVDKMYHEDTYYAFDLTNYINTRLQEPVVDTDRGLVITLPDDNMGSSFTWLRVNDQNVVSNPSELQLYYYYYDNE